MDPDYFSLAVFAFFVNENDLAHDLGTDRDERLYTNKTVMKDENVIPEEKDDDYHSGSDESYNESLNRE
jgi:hypothetical protein